MALPIIYFTTMIRSKDVTDVERSRVKSIHSVIYFRNVILGNTRTKDRARIKHLWF